MIVLLCTGLASSLVWCVNLGTTTQEEYKAVREHPEEEHEDSEGSRGEAIQEVAVVTWLVQPGEE